MIQGRTCIWPLLSSEHTDSAPHFSPSFFRQALRLQASEGFEPGRLRLARKDSNVGARRAVEVHGGSTRTVSWVSPRSLCSAVGGEDCCESQVAGPPSWWFSYRPNRFIRSLSGPIPRVLCFWTEEPTATTQGAMMSIKALKI